MPYLFTCPHCQTQTMVDDQYSGQSGECVTCGRPVQLPRFTSGEGLPASPKTAPIRLIAGMAVGIALLLAIGFVAVRYGGQGMETIRQNRLRGMCIQNIEKIAKALDAYALDYGSYPPPTTFAADGVTPMHSWRVLILPYLGETSLYSNYNMDLPWDDPENQRWALQPPEVFQSPASIAIAGDEINYFLITGPGTLFPATGPLGPQDVGDEATKTLLVIEADSGPSTVLQWMQPGDFEIARTSLTIGVVLGGSHVGGTTAATVDMRGHFLQDSLDPVVLKALITPNGGEGLSDDVLD